MRFVVEPGFRVSGAEVSRDASSFSRRGPGMSFPPTPSRVPDSQKYIPVAFSDIVYRRPWLRQLHLRRSHLPVSYAQATQSFQHRSIITLQLFDVV